MFGIKKGEIFVPFKLSKLPLSQKMSNSHDSYTPHLLGKASRVEELP